MNSQKGKNGHSLFWLTFTKSQVKSVLPQLRKDNLETLRSLSLFGGCAFLLSSLFPLLYKKSVSEFIVYLSISALCFAFNFCARLSLKKSLFNNMSIKGKILNFSQMLLFIYLLIGFTIYIGVFKNLNHPATLFYVIVLLTECLFYFDIINSSLILLISVSVFITFTIKLKPSNIWMYDIVNCSIDCILVCFTWYSNITNRIKQRLEEQRLSEANIALWDISNKDPLTKLYNRRKFNEEMQKLLIARDLTKSTLAFFMIDIDNFHSFNEMYGHDKGDNVLILISETMITSAVKHDIVIGRWGGEEFMAVVPTATSEEAQAIAEEIRSSIENLHIINRTLSGQRYLTVSIGLHVLSGRHSETWEEIYHNSSELLIHAKQNGKNRIEFSLN